MCSREAYHVLQYLKIKLLQILQAKFILILKLNCLKSLSTFLKFYEEHNMGRYVVK